MVSDSIERETVIEAPPEVVWDVVTDPAHIRAWWGAAAELDLRPGGEGALSWAEFDTTVPLRVEQVERPRVFSFRWVYPEGAEPRRENSLLVEFTLVPEGGRTRLRVVESGLSAVDWEPERKESYFGDHTRGWDRHVPALARLAADQAQVQALR